MCAFIRPASSGGRRTFACRRSAGGGSIRRPARVPWLPRRTRFIDCTLGRLRARRAPIRGLVATRWRSRLLRQLSYRPRGQTRGACSCPTWRVGFPLHTGEFARRTYSELQSGPSSSSTVRRSIVIAVRDVCSAADIHGGAGYLAAGLLLLREAQSCHGRLLFARLGGSRSPRGF